MTEAPANSYRSIIIAAVLSLLVFIAYYSANPQSGWYYDYTLRIASAMLDGKVGLVEEPPSWLNEMIPHEGKFYSAFPLGSVLVMLPLAIFQRLNLFQLFPGTLLAALLAAVITIFCYLLSAKYEAGILRRVVLTLFPALATWMWANLAFAGAWHIALGFAVAGQLASLYFILIRFNPLMAGLCFAVAFGNRTEIILLAPVFVYLIYRRKSATESETSDPRLALVKFLVFPFLLGVATLAYNYARFASAFDFGYARIPGVLEEPWYEHGIFSLHAIPLNAEQMLIETWKRIDRFPYLVPTGFGGSIFLSSPFLIFLFRTGARDRTLKLLAWGAILLLTLVLWCHGNPGGWQYSYRYAMELLPWMFLILLENSPRRATPLELAVFIISVAINAYGTYLFLRTDYISPEFDLSCGQHRDR